MAEGMAPEGPATTGLTFPGTATKIHDAVTRAVHPTCG